MMEAVFGRECGGAPEYRRTIAGPVRDGKYSCRLFDAGIAPIGWNSLAKMALLAPEELRR
jgi:hypothetical protein